MIDYILENRNGNVGVVHLVDDIFRRFHGFFMDANEECMILNLIESAAFCLNGWEAIRMDVIQEVNVYELPEHWPNQACRQFNMTPEELPFELSGNFFTLLKFFSKSGELVAVYCDFENYDGFEIGVVVDVSGDAIRLKTITPTGIWDDEITTIDFSDITRIGFRNRYLKALAHAAKNGKQLTPSV